MYIIERENMSDRNVVRRRMRERKGLNVHERARAERRRGQSKRKREQGESVMQIPCRKVGRMKAR